MSVLRLISYCVFFALNVFSAATLGQAQTKQEGDQKGALGMKVIQIDGPYTYEADGVPVLGWIIERLSEGKVRFRMCSEKTAVLNANLLRETSGHCPKGRGGPIPWFAFEGKLVPFLPTVSVSNELIGALYAEKKSKDGIQIPNVNLLKQELRSTDEISKLLERYRISIDALPSAYRPELLKAPTNRAVAISFKEQNSWTLGIIKSTYGFRPLPEPKQ